jgi:hypothetical protein
MKGRQMKREMTKEERELMEAAKLAIEFADRAELMMARQRAQDWVLRQKGSEAPEGPVRGLKRGVDTSGLGNSWEAYDGPLKGHSTYRRLRRR